MAVGSLKGRVKMEHSLDVNCQKHACGLTGAAITQPIRFDVEHFFRKKVAEGSVRYTMDAHNILYRRIMVIPNSVMRVYMVVCGGNSSDEEMRRFITSYRYFTPEEALEFLVAAFECPMSPTQLARGHRNVIYLKGGAALSIEWFDNRKTWNIERIRNSSDVWQAGDRFFSRYDIDSGVSLVA